MILIADGGSTKADWCLVGRQSIFYFETEGYNPYFVNEDYIVTSLGESLPKDVNADAIKEIYFYGAGCLPDKIWILKKAFQQLFTHAKCHIELDLLAAARAILGTNPGFIAILGTGTNTCIYDGNCIIHSIHSLGFFLGDEGSGAAIGKKVITDYIRNKMPNEIASAFFNTYGLNAQELLNHIYNEPTPNRFCASMTKFIKAHINNNYSQEVVKRAFHDLFENLVCSYPNHQVYKFNCIGSVGYHFKSLLGAVASIYNMELGLIVKSPMEGLVNFHVNQR